MNNEDKKKYEFPEFGPDDDTEDMPEYEYKPLASEDELLFPDPDLFTCNIAFTYNR